MRAFEPQCGLAAPAYTRNLRPESQPPQPQASLKVALLGAANSIHIIRWAEGLSARGAEIHLISLQGFKEALPPRVRFHALPGWGGRWSYFTAAPALRKILRRLAPDILHAHYVSGYGTLAALSGFKPFLLSAWGDDLFEFPEKSRLHKALVKRNLLAATALAATSRCLAERVRGLGLRKPVLITPFGVDTDVFQPAPAAAAAQEKPFVIGTVKALAPKYGVDLLMRAFAAAWTRLGQPDNWRLEITGDGPERAALALLAGRLHIGERVTFHGAVPHAQVPARLNRLDIYLALSRGEGESFGVAVLEAAACEKPIIVSDVPGLAETTLDGITGLVTPKEQPEAAAEAIIRLVREPGLAARLGRAARRHVLENYSWPKALDLMLGAYAEATSGLRPELRLQGAAL